MRKVTAIIPTFNEAHNIRSAIESVLWADEIIVVDSFSEDNTPQIAKSFSRVNFVQHEYVNSATQKNWIIPQAKNEWIFILDADERVDEKLKKEIERVLSQKEISESAFWVKRQNYFLGKKLNFIWKGDAVVRLFKRDENKYEDKAVHAEIISSGIIGQLKNVIRHHSFKDLNHFEDKMRRYAIWSAKDFDQKTGNIGFYHLTIKPSFRFFKHYILQLGILDGSAGYTISRLMAKGVKDRYILLKKMREERAAQ